MLMVDGFYHKTKMGPTKILPIASILGYWANIKPNLTALSHESESMTWSDFEKETNRLARAYDSFGVQENSFVVVGLPNGFEFFLACLRLGSWGLHLFQFHLGYLNLNGIRFLIFPNLLLFTVLMMTTQKSLGAT